MYFTMEALADTRSASNPGSATLIPPLLLDETTSLRAFDGRLRVAYAARPGQGGIACAQVEHNFVLIAGTVRAMGSPTILTPEEILYQFSKGTTTFGGQYLVCIYDDAERRVQTLTTLARLIPAYFRRTASSILVSNRQAAVAEAVGTPELNTGSIAAFSGQGYLPNDSALLEGVSLCQANALTTVPFHGSVTSNQCDDTLEQIGTRALDTDYIDQLVASLSAAFNPIQNTNIQVGLTAGRDSRLIVALLNASGAKFSTYTLTSREEGQDLDVDVARLVARELAIPHETKFSHARPTDRPDVSKLVERLKRTAVNTDLSVFGYDTLARWPAKFNTDRLIYNGGGGELLRVAYGDRAWLSSERANARIRQHASGAEYLSGPNAIRYGNWLESWIENNSHLSPASMLNKFSLLYRTGRWGSGVFASTYGGLSQRPYYDNDVLRLALGIDPIYAATDALYYEILVRTEPSLLMIPFGTRAWGLERTGMDRYQRLSERLPQPLQTDSPSRAPSKPNWRLDIRGVLGDELMRIIRTASQHHEELLMFDLNALRAALVSDNSRITRKGMVKRLWATASIAVSAALIGGEPEIFE